MKQWQMLAGVGALGVGAYAFWRWRKSAAVAAAAVPAVTLQGGKPAVAPPTTRAQNIPFDTAISVGRADFAARREAAAQVAASMQLRGDAGVAQAREQNKAAVANMYVKLGSSGQYTAGQAAAIQQKVPGSATTRAAADKAQEKGAAAQGAVATGNQAAKSFAQAADNKTASILRRL